MTEREQWRFQWPDGTWIRWNPQTQSWEKEDQGEAAPARASERARAETPAPRTPAREPVAERPAPPRESVTERPAPARTTPGGWRPAAERPAQPVGSPPVRAPEPEPAAVETVTEPITEPPELEEEQETHARTPRRNVAEVLPPRNPDRPGGSLWPTIVAGAVVGVAVGLLLSTVVR